MEVRRDVFAKSQELGDHFASRQVTDEAVLGRRTERAVDGTADLGRYTDGIAIVVLHEDRFYRFPISQLQQELHRLSVRSIQAGHDFREIDWQRFLQLLPVFLGQQDHVIPGKDILLIHIMKNLVGPEFFHPQGDEERLKFLFSHIKYIIHVSPPFSCGQ